MELLQALADHRFSKLRDSYRHLRLLKTNIGQQTLSSGNLPTIRKIAMVGRLSKMEEVLRQCSIIWEGELRAQIKTITLNPYNHNKLLYNSSTKSRMATLERRQGVCSVVKRPRMRSHCSLCFHTIKAFKTT